MNSFRLAILSSITIFFISSCRIMYIPNAHNVPQLEEKKDLKALLTITDLQLSYALTNNIGILFNGFYSQNDYLEAGQTLNEKGFSKRYLIEGGFGYFHPLDEIIQFEIYGGAGMGKVHYRNLATGSLTDEEYPFDVNIIRAFIQPSLGKQYENFGISLSNRVTGMTFKNIDYSGYTYDVLVDNGLHELDNYFVFWEPALTLRGGIKQVQLQFQTYGNLLVYGPESIYYRKFGFNIGLYFSIEEFFKPKSEADL